MASQIQRAAKEFLLAAKARPDGFFQEDVDKQFPDRVLLKSVLNTLLKKARVHMRQDVANGRPVFYYVEPRIAKKLTNHSREEIEMYHMIAQCGDEGIWKRTLKRQGNFPGNTMDKMFARLNKSELVNQLDTHHSKKKKVYIRADVVPSPLITGGDFYNGGQFDKAFADVVSEFCLEFCDDKEEVTLAEVHESVNQSLGEQFKQVTKKGVNQVMGCLVVDGVLELVGKKLKLDPSKVAKALQPASSSSVPRKRERSVSTDVILESTKYKKNRFTFEDKESMAFQIPCSACPIATQCHSGGIISPEKCEYMKTWVECETETDSEKKDDAESAPVNVDDMDW